MCDVKRDFSRWPHALAPRSSEDEPPRGGFISNDRPALLAPLPAVCLTGPAYAPGRRPSPRELLFDLEDRLPAAAEAVAADFVPVAGESGTAWGVAVPAGPLAGVIGALETGGVAAGPLVPWPLLAGPPESEGDAVTVWDAGGSLELVEHAGGRPRGWTHAARSADAAARTLRHLALTRPRYSSKGPRVVLRTADPAFAAALRDALSGEFEVIDSDGPTLDEAAAAGAAAVLAGKSDPPVDLRTGPLADPDPLRAVRGPLRLAFAALALALLLVTAALLWRAGRLESLAEERQIAAEGVYRDLFPGTPVPAAVRRRLESERAAAEGLRGGAGAAPEAPDAAATLAAVLAALPDADELPLRVDDLRAEGRRADLSGAVRELSDVARLAAALRGSGLTVPPPRSRRSGREVTFDLTAERPADDAARGRAE